MLLCGSFLAILDAARSSVIVGEKRGAYRVFGRESGHLEVLGVNGDNIKMGLYEIIWEVVEWIDMAKDTGQVAGCCEDGNESSGLMKCGDFPD
jgi:hypothetical protein